MEARSARVTGKDGRVRCPPLAFAPPAADDAAADISRIGKIKKGTGQSGPEGKVPSP